ncbi:hypothetical protein [uncultured Nostoc sp.]
MLAPAAEIARIQAYCPFLGLSDGNENTAGIAELFSVLSVS